MLQLHMLGHRPLRPVRFLTSIHLAYVLPLDFIRTPSHTFLLLVCIVLRDLLKRGDHVCQFLFFLQCLSQLLAEAVVIRAQFVDLGDVVVDGVIDVAVEVAHLQDIRFGIPSVLGLVLCCVWEDYEGVLGALLGLFAHIILQFRLFGPIQIRIKKQQTPKGNLYEYLQLLTYGQYISLFKIFQTYNLTVIYINLNSLAPSMSIEKDKQLDSRSRQTTEEDSSSDRDQEQFYLRTNPAKHKTQLCKTFSELGQCPYDHKCRFAHGRHQLIQAVKTNSKNRKCNGFWKNGSCSYGIRCQFGHAEFKWQDLAVMSALQAANQNQVVRKSKLMKLLL